MSKRSSGAGSNRTPPPAWGRFADALRNGLEIAREGGIGERAARSPFEIVAEGPNHRVRRYGSPAETGWASEPGAARPPALLVPPLMMSAELWDVAPGASAVETLIEAGIDPWVVDFGSPEQEVGGLDRTLSDHVLAIARAVDCVQATTGQPVHLMGYSQGGMFAYQAAAYRHSRGIASLVTFGSSVDLHRNLPGRVPPERLIEAIDRFGSLQQALIPHGIPSWATRLGFQLLDPVKTLQQRLDFLGRLSDREALEKSEGMRRFMQSEGWTAFPGPALSDLVRQLVAQNRMLQGGLVIDGQTVTLAELTCPILAFIGDRDSIAPPDSVRAIHAAAPRAEAYQAHVATGHFGLVVGSAARETTWPTVIEWLDWCGGGGDRPGLATPIPARRDATSERAPSPLEDLQAVGTLLWELGSGLLGRAVEDTTQRVGFVGRFVRNVAPQFSRLSRLGEIRSTTRISPGRALQERAAASPENTFFLFEGRAHSYADAHVRIDHVVRGLIACGVRPGQHVGLLMDTRPSAVAAAVGLSRLGAVPVMLRPDLPLLAQREIVQLDHLISDPEHAEAARQAFEQEVLVLGGGGEPRVLGPGFRDMEAIDPAHVALPSWYVPDPGIAGELAMVLITGDAEHVSPHRVSNRRWATSAYGTASSCALTSQDTVYCCSPTHHATGMLVCVGGALVSGARLAMASEFATAIDPGRFWRDVRRYGVNVVFYSGALCHVLVNAPHDPQERHHSIRLFAGSGMPKGVWTRMKERFPGTNVVEFFASSEGNAVLVNLSGKKLGSLGRPLPGAGELAVAAWNLDAGRLIEESSGFARPSAPGQLGLLLERFDPGRGELAARPLRSVFEAGDAWLDTRDLVRVDRAGDHWLIDRVTDVIHGAHGAVASVAIEDLLCARLDGIDLAAVYGIAIPGVDHAIPVAALTLRPGEKLDPAALRRIVTRQLPIPHQPLVVRVLDTLPMTAGHRPRKSTLRSEGLGFAASGGQTLWLAPDQPAYVPLASEDLPQLIAHC